MNSVRLAAACTLLASTAAFAQQQQRRPLDHSVYDGWRRIEGQALSPDGRWVLYHLVPGDGDNELRVRAAAGPTEHIIARGQGAQFTADSRFVVFTIKPALAATRRARRERRRTEQMPKDSLGILDLTSGEVTRVARLSGFRLPARGTGWLAYQVDRDSAARRDSTARPDSAARRDSTARRKRDDGYPLVIRNLATGAEQRFPDVSAYAFAENGRRLAFATATRDGSGDGLSIVTLPELTVTRVLSGDGHYRQIALDRAGRQAAFLTDRDEATATQPAYALYWWREGGDSAQTLVRTGAAAVPQGWWVSEHGDVSFSEAGGRLFFGTAPRPEPEVEDSTPENERVRVDIWHWRDPQLPLQQIRQLDQERRRNYRAVVHLADRRVVQIGTPDIPVITVAARGDGDLALGEADVPYRLGNSWETPGFRDVWLINVRTGDRRRVVERLQARPFISPSGRWLTWFDGRDRAWLALDTRGGQPLALSRDIPHPVHDEEHDAPQIPDDYGSAGWTDNDEAFLVYDRYDVWATDPTGRTPPRSITEGAGRRDSIRFRVVPLDRDRQTLSPTAPLLLAAFNWATKSAGFYRDVVRGTRAPEQVVWAERRFGQPLRADSADVFLFTREDFREFPNLWVSGPDLAAAQQVSDANPQQAQFSWGTAVPVRWQSADGTPLQGILYRPEGFDSTRRYPMMVTFYERNSDNLYAHHMPQPHRSPINYSFYASRGYLVFVPDIRYRTGYPGESALNCVVPGVLSLIARGFVDAEHIGVQGHSWGGYQIAYLVTRTNIFHAAEAGAPVANMTSAYGGIRYESGLSRMFQYERAQSRIGQTLWEAPLRYVENSPLFWADKVRTPLLIMHNDQDGAVPWTQGIELFTALRRLGRPAWMITYNGEPHWPTTWVNKRDFQLRLQQYFDHYLRNAPAPVWLAEGVPAIRKGRTLGTELIERAVVTSPDRE